MSNKFKKTLIVFAILTIMATLFVACDPTEQQEIVKVKSIEITNTSDGVEIKDFSITDMKFTVTDTKGNTYIINGALSMLSDEDKAKLATSGTHKITFNYQNVSTEVDIILYPNSSDPSNPDEIITVTFVTNGGTVISSINKKEAFTIEKEPVTTKEGATFDGWYADSDFGTSRITFPYSLKRSMVLYAKWIENQITITFDGNANDAYNVPETQNIGIGKTLLSFKNPSRVGYEFEAWYTSPDFKEGTKIDYSTVFMSSKTLFAKWIPKRFKITYDLADGKITGNDDTVFNKYYSYNTNIDKIESPTKQGFKFIGWFLEEDLSAWDASSYLFSVMPANDLKLTAKWAVEDNNKFFKYEIDIDEKAVIVGADPNYTKANTATHLTIPNTICGYDVKAIADNAFSDFTSLIALKIADGIKSIGEEAFGKSRKLNSDLSSIPRSVNNIGKNAFSENWEYDKINGNNNFAVHEMENGEYILIKYLGAEATVTIPDGIVKIAEYAFVEDEKLGNPIGNGLKEINIPASVQIIGKSAFHNCKNLEAVTFAENSQIKNVHSTAFKGTPFLNLKSTKNENLIFGDLFYKYYANNDTVTIPSHIKFLSDYLFEDSNVSNIVFENEANMQTIGKNAFNSNQYRKLANNTPFSVINGILIHYNGKAETVIIPENVKTISSFAFGDENTISNIRNLIIGNSVVEIKANAFYGMEDTKFTFMNTIPPTLDLSAFYMQIENENQLLPNMRLYLMNESNYSQTDVWSILANKLNNDNESMDRFIQLRAMEVKFGDGAIKQFYELNECFDYLKNVINIITNDGYSHKLNDKTSFDFSEFNSENIAENYLLADHTQYFVKIRGEMVPYNENDNEHKLSERYYKAFADYVNYENYYFNINGINYIVDAEYNLVEYDGLDKKLYDGNIIYVKESNGLFVNESNNYKAYDRSDESQVYLAKFAFTYYKCMNLKVSYPKGTKPVNVLLNYVVEPEISDIETEQMKSEYFTDDKLDIENAIFKIKYNYGFDYIYKTICLVNYISEANATNLQLNLAERYVYINDKFIKYDKTNEQHEGLEKFVRVINENFKIENFSTENGNTTNKALISFDGFDFEFEYKVTEPIVVSLRIDDSIPQEDGTTNPNKLVNLYGISEELDKANCFITCIYNNGKIEYVSLKDDNITVEGFDTSIPATNKAMTITYHMFEEPLEVTYSVEAVTAQNVFDYNLDKGAITINGLNEELRVIYISKNFEIDGVLYPVKYIASNAFSNIQNVEFIEIPSSVVEIGDNAFQDSAFKTIKFGEGSLITTIPNYAFYNTNKLKEIDFGKASIKKIGDYAFAKTALESFDLPSSVEIIGYHAFFNAITLGKVYINERSVLERIEASAFENCSLLNTIVLPETLLSIGNKTFANSGLYEITIPAQIENIPSFCFHNCDNLTKVILSSNIKVIHDDAFNGCQNLSMVDFGGFIPNSEGDLVYDREQNKFIDFDPSIHSGYPRFNKEYKSDKNGNLVLIDGEYIQYNPIEHDIHRYNRIYKLNTDGMGEYVQINENEYVLISELPKFTLCYEPSENGEYIENEGQYVLYDAANPEHQDKQRYNAIYNEAENGTFLLINDEYLEEFDTYDMDYIKDDMGEFVKINDEFIPYDPEIHNITLERFFLKWIPDENGKFSFIGGDSENEESYVIYDWYLHDARIRYSASGSLLETIGNRAFFECENLIDTGMANNISTIGEMAFKNCYKLKDLNFNENLNIIDDEAFKNSGIEKIILPEGLSYVGKDAFVNCDNAISVQFLSPNIKIIADNMFNGCNNLQYIYTKYDLEAIGKQAFMGCENLIGFSKTPDVLSDECNLPASIKIIGEDAFNNCNKLKSSNMAGFEKTLLENIESYAFQNSGLEFITLPSLLKGIGDYAFDNCGNLKNVNFKLANLESIGDCAFRDSAITSSSYGDLEAGVLQLTNNLITIGKRAFADCINIKTIIIPENNLLQVIGESAFNGCYELQNLTIGHSKKQDGNYLSNLTIGESSFENCKITELFIPNSVKAIKKNAFRGCVDLRTVNFGISINRTVWINDGENNYVETVKNVNADTDKLQPNLSEIEEGAFAGTNKLNKIYSSFVSALPNLAKTNVGIGSEQNVFTDTSGASHFADSEFKFVIVDNQNAEIKLINDWKVDKSQIERNILDYTITPPNYYYTQP